MIIAMPATRSVPDTSGRTPQAYGWIAGRPVRPGEEVDRADLQEELERLEGQHEDDADGRDDTEGGRQEQQGLDDPLATSGVAGSADLAAARHSM